MAFLDDMVLWGPVENFVWQLNTWYWLRLRHEPNAASQGGVNDVFGKIWLGDGTQAEPANWQLTWNYTTTEPARTGFAGITASSGGAFQFDVDYILIKASGLPSILVAPEAFVQTPVTITNQPQSQTVMELLAADFSVVALGNPVPYYQWYLGGSAISGATNATFSLDPVPYRDNGAQFYVVVQNEVSNITYAVTSAVVTLTVIADTTPPILLGAQSVGLSQVQLSFSKLMSAVTATNTTNYALAGPNGAVPVLSATQDSSQSNVVLSVGTMVEGGRYILTVNHLIDQTAMGNVIAPNSQASFIASTYQAAAVGNPILPGSQLLTTNGLILIGAGATIGGTNDQCQFSYQMATGNFDIAVRLGGLSLSDTWAKAGLMARESLAPGGRFAAALATPVMNGCFFAWRDPTNGTAQSAGAFPDNYPNTWLRLNRVGNLFSGFASYDGQTWTLLASQNISLANQLYLGFAVDSDQTNQTVTAQFAVISNTGPNAVIATQTNPHEAMGPSSRTTGIVFSEIMYKPAPRADPNNCEFVELYNSTPWFFDLSGYQIVCADMQYTVPTNVIIPGGGYLVVAASPASIQAVYGITNVLGPYTGSLKHAETLELLDEQGRLLLTVPYTDTFPWPVAADGTGHSIVLANPTYGEGDPRAWDISDIRGGSPGTMESYWPSPQRSVVIDEVLAHSENSAVARYVKLYNHSASAVDLSGCILTDDTTVNQFIIPAGTSIPAGGFLSFEASLGFALNPAGDTIFLINSNQTRVLDALPFAGQADGVSYGRWPDGANDFYPLQTREPGTNNGGIVIGNIVINELMYDPISKNDDDQYIELYNQGTNTVNLANWQFTEGVKFTFPPGASIGPNGYVVVGLNTSELFSNYPNLNPANTYGNYSGKLSHNGERVALSMPESLYGTNTIYVVEDEVTYGVGGRWGQWSSGGGSSLELIDPHANHHLAANWADSDDTSKSQWMDIENTGVLDNGQNYESGIEHAQIGLLDAGECLVDNIEVDYNGKNYVANSTFESGLTGWSLQGCMACSSLEDSGYGGSQYSLHIRCSDRVWTGDNSCEVNLNANSLKQGVTATLRFKARWLHGWPEALFRLNGAWLEATGSLAVPANLGTPGAPNSQLVTNAGPAIYNVTHTPCVPAANQPVVVTANVHDPDGVQNLTLYYRLDPATTYTAVPMNDKGVAGDAMAGDGIFSATIPGQAASQIVAFYLSATDNLGASTRFPALRANNNEAPRECVVMFGDGNPGGSFAVCHLWITQTNVTRWANLGNLSRDWKNDCTLVTGSRVIYNLGGRFSGSPAHQIYDTPIGSPCTYEWKFSEDDKFLGATSYKKLHIPGATPGSDTSLQRSQLAFTFLRALGEPWLYKRYMVLYVNGSRRGVLIGDTQVPDSDVVKEDFPNDSDGYLYKIAGWDELAPFLSGETMGYTVTWCNLTSYTTTGGVKKPARYRWNYEMRRTPDSNSDFTNVFSLVDAANSAGTPNYVANMENMANMENWMRVFAAVHATGDWDLFGSDNGQNLFEYIGTQGTKYTLVVWELESIFGSTNNASWSPGANLFNFNGNDPNLGKIYSNPTFLRMYWRALQEMVNGPLEVANSEPLLDAKYHVFLENGLSPIEDPNINIKPWMTAARTSIVSQLAAVNATSFSVKPTITPGDDVAYVTGGAPVNVEAVWINGVAYPLTWTSLTNWTVTVPLTNGANHLSVVGVGNTGQPVAGASNEVTVSYSGTTPSPVGHVTINEIMYDPAVNNAEYVELFNNSTNATFDLSGWQVQGLSYTFPSGSLLPPLGFLVLAANRPAFAAAYGATKYVFDTFNATLSPGQLLSLLQPNGTNNVIVAQVRFDDVSPWPTNANNPGVSLQLIDSHQDNWRVGNWNTGQTKAATPDATNSVAANLPTFPPLWINEVDPDNLTGLTNRAGQAAPWLELFNPSTNSVTLAGLYLTSSYTDLTNWAFPAGATMSPGEFLVVFADGQTNLSSADELHTSFTLSPGAGSVALSRVFSGEPQVLDYVDYTDLPPDFSYGSLPNGQSFIRVFFGSPTPGASNALSGATTASFIAYNNAGSIYTQNFDSLPNPGATSVDSANPVTLNGLTYSMANPFDFAGTVSASSKNGGLGLPAMAGWYGLANPAASVGTRFGASDGDQTAGGQISFGSPDSPNRALGLLATSTTGYTAFGAKFINNTGTALHYLNVQASGEIWRQSDKAKTLECYYFIDPTAAAPMSVAETASLPALDVSFPTDPVDVGGSAVDGTNPTNQMNLAVTNQVITNWPPGGALWLVWEMADATGKAQGLAIDNLNFSATAQSPSTNAVSLSVQGPASNQFILSWPTAAANYQLYAAGNLTPPVLWTQITNAPIISNGTNSVAIATTNAGQFFRLLER
ncbi:MAG: lamin tail domain-containing protein [Limisphaerales bacterium]